MAFTAEFLRANNVEKLQTSFESPIVVKVHPTVPNLLLFKYKQSAGKHFKYKIMREVRGLILDKKQNWKPVAYPYDKFFNRNETGAPKEHEIDWDSVRVTEKADGTLICLFYYQGKWRISTTGQPDAGESQNTNKSFYSIFWNLWNRLGMTLPDADDQNLCFMFELMTVENRIVVRMEEAGHGEILWLHGIRNMNTLLEIQPQNVITF